MKNNLNLKNNNKGFTLIETLVSLALFSVVLVITGGVIISIIQVNKKNQAVGTVVSNLNYSIDSMVRDIKTGYLYRCNYGDGVGEYYTVQALKNSSATTTNEVCDINLTLVSTISGKDTVVKYELISNIDDINQYIQKTVYDEDAGTIQPYSVTDKNNVNITDLYINTSVPDSIDVASTTPGVMYGQPSVFISIKGVAGNKDIDASNFFIQTFISQRLINLTDFNDNN